MQETMNDALNRVLGSSASDGGGARLTDAIARNTAQLAAVQSTLEGQLNSLAENTRAVVDRVPAGTSTLATAASSAIQTVLGGGPLGSLASGLMQLFGGDDSGSAPPPLVKFALPSSVHFAAGVDGSSTGAVDYGQNDRARMQTAGATQVTVNVSAMDSRSFLDHSTEIASAVRKAILESSSLNDVLGEM